ncbi:MAG: hypothetical protein JW912_02010 [Sedimentisphaerales bacterium]|nr:hypothetical protein [Sedimentisphaerales bacterium]
MSDKTGQNGQLGMIAVAKRKHSLIVPFNSNIFLHMFIPVTIFKSGTYEMAFQFGYFL